MSRLNSSRRLRGLWFALALLVLAVQTGLPAHEDSHPVGHSETLCQYCAIGGNLFGMPHAATPPPASAAQVEAPLPVLRSFAVSPFPRTRFGRAPPSRLDA